MGKKNRKKPRKAEFVVKSMTSPIADPNGSYTGRPVDGGKPVQDADDL